MRNNPRGSEPESLRLRAPSFLVSRPVDMRIHSANGFTLIEIVLGALTLVVAATAILGAYLGQGILNEHARNLSLAVQDANRVIEQIRLQNSPCNPGPNPSAVQPFGVSWDDWLQTLPNVKSIGTPNVVNTNELVVITCQNRTGTAIVACNNAGAPPEDPLRVTVAICWRQRLRTIGECMTAGALAPADGTNGPDNIPGVVESPAMLTTLVTCRS